MYPSLLVILCKQLMYMYLESFTVKDYKYALCVAAKYPLMEYLVTALLGLAFVTLHSDIH